MSGAQASDARAGRVCQRRENGPESQSVPWPMGGFIEETCDKPQILPDPQPLLL